MAPSLLLGAVMLAGCASRAPDNLTSKVLFTVNGSYDASADSRTRQGRGMRRVQWRRQPPLAAGQVTVDYEGDARSLGWMMTIDAPKFDAKALGAAGPGVPSAQNAPGAQATALFIGSGDLKDTLALQSPRQLILLSRGYAARHSPELLPDFK